MNYFISRVALPLAFYGGIFFAFALPSGFFTKRWNFRMRLTGALTFIAISVAWTFVFPLINERLDAMMAYLVTMRVPVALVVVAAGIGAHKFKQKNQYRYGQVEVVFGVLSSVYVISTTTIAYALSQWTALTGAAYVIARGLNNISDALAKANAPPAS